MSATAKGTTSKRQKRAPTACDFCRRRKMKCDNEKPKCHNCLNHGKNCVYVELVKNPRPSIARISQLEQENKRLQQQFLSLKEQAETAKGVNGILSAVNVPNSLCRMPRSCPSNSTTRPLQGRPSLSQSLQIPTPDSFSSSTPFAQEKFSPDNESCYHGPTSAVFDEKSYERIVHRVLSSTAKTPEVVKCQLIAETARQRQLEAVNLIAGKLDFDGVEPELGTHLLSIYWNRQLISGPVVYRTAFVRDMACAGPYFSRLLLNAIYFYASKYSPRLELRQDPNNCLTAGFRFRRRAVELLGGIFDKSNITTIQALLIMSTAIFSWCDEKSVSWLYAGMAFNMIIDLGIHVDSSTLKRTFSDEELEIRRRIFWAAYVNDKLQSLYQGRPSCLRTSGTNLPLLFSDEYEELELFSPLSYNVHANAPISPRYSISSFTQTCKLSIILERISNTLYTEQSVSRDPDDLLHEATSLHEELKGWKKSLQPHLNFLPSDAGTGIPMPHTLALLAMYNVLIILLHRPFVSDGHLHSERISAARHAFSICSNAAFEVDEILRAYEKAFCFKATPYIISYATYVSATIHIRLAAQGRRGADAHRALRRCVDVLDIHQTVCWSSRRAKRVVDGLIARMGVVLSSEDSQIQNTDTVLSDLDIEEIIRTFALEQQNSRSPRRHFDTNDNGSVISKSPQTQTSDLSNNSNDQLETYSATWIGEEFGQSYEPIYGFSGSAFDDLDFGLECDFL